MCKNCDAVKVHLVFVVSKNLFAVSKYRDVQFPCNVMQEIKNRNGCK